MKILKLSRSLLSVQGAFREDGELCMGEIKVEVKWGNEKRLAKLCVFKHIRTNFIIGVKVLKQFGIGQDNESLFKIH